MEISQRMYSPSDYCAASSIIPCQMRQKLYDLSLNLRVYVFDKDIMKILEEEVERMFLSVDELEKVMHKLDTQIAELDDDDLLMTAVSLTEADHLDETFESDEEIDYCMSEHVYPDGDDGSKDRFNTSNINICANSMDPNCVTLNIWNKNDFRFNLMENELHDIHREVIFLIREMEENMERLERIMKKFMISGPQSQNQ
ncbi:2654_t:CDS:2, partial [Acaulospora morrowiae]